jgi:hypothetical protein
LLSDVEPDAVANAITKPNSNSDGVTIALSVTDSQSFCDAEPDTDANPVPKPDANANT